MAFKLDTSPLVQSSRNRMNMLAGLGSSIGNIITNAKKGQSDRQLSGLASKALEGDTAAQDELSYTSPEINKEVTDRLNLKTEAQQKGFIYDLTNSLNLHETGTPEDVVSFLSTRADSVDKRGGDSQHTREVLGIYARDPDRGAQFISKTIRALVNPEAFAKGLGGGVDQETKVGAQEILEDGTIIQSTARGPVVYSPTGEKLKGQAAADAIKIARAEKVSNDRKTSGAKKTASLEAEHELKAKVEAGVISAKEAAKISIKAFDRLEKINMNIANMNEGIQILTDDPTMTGPVMKMLPSVRKNAIKLNNLQGRLGLDVLQSTTFGALSAAELKFALSTALPTGLRGPELKEWMIQRRNAQEKLSDYIEASAIFLGTPGNTVKDWIVLQKEKRGERQELAESGVTQDPTAPANTTEMSNEDLMKAAFGGQ